MMKAKEIKNLSAEELNKKLDELKKDLFMLRMQHATNQLDNPMQIAAVKKDIARIKKLHLAEEQEKKLIKDAEKLKKQPFGSSEASVLRNYLDTVLDLPWNVKTKCCAGLYPFGAVESPGNLGGNCESQKFKRNLIRRQKIPCYNEPVRM